MSTFRNLNELNIIWNKQALNVVNYVTEKAVETIKEEIEKIGIGSSGDTYISTGEFENAFVNELSNMVMGYFQGTFYYDSSMVTYNEDNEFVHGSFGNSVAEGLAEIIFEGKSGDLFGEGFWRAPRNAWDSAGDMINKNIDKWFKEGFKKEGINIKSNI